MASTRQRALTLRGPRGEKVVVDLSGMRLQATQRKALQKAMAKGGLTAGALRGLSLDEREALAKLRARVRGPGNAALVVRFDCKWVRID